MKTHFARIAAPVIAATALVLLAATTDAQTRDAQTRAPTSSSATSKQSDKRHRVIVQVNTNDPATMNLALNNAANVHQYYADLGEMVEIEIVTFGPGLHMLRDDTSPVKERVKSMAENFPSVSFKACANTQENMAKAERRTIALLPQASIVKSGVVRVMELQEQGWSYVRP